MVIPNILDKLANHQDFVLGEYAGSESFWHAFFHILFKDHPNLLDVPVGFGTITAVRFVIVESILVSWCDRLIADTYPEFSARERKERSDDLATKLTGLLADRRAFLDVIEKQPPSHEMPYLRQQDPIPNEATYLCHEDIVGLSPDLLAKWFENTLTMRDLFLTQPHILLRDLYMPAR